MSSKYSLPSAPLLLLVSDRTRYGDRSLEDILVAALAGGVNMIELHEADMTARDLLGEAERLRKLALGGVPLVVFDRVDGALLVPSFHRYEMVAELVRETVRLRDRARVKTPAG